MALSYGKRRSLRDIYTGICTAALTYLRRSFLSYTRSTQATFAQEGESKRLASCMLDIKPIVTRHVHQPFGLELIESQRIHTTQERKAARSRRPISGLVFSPSLDNYRLITSDCHHYLQSSMHAASPTRQGQ